MHELMHNRAIRFSLASSDVPPSIKGRFSAENKRAAPCRCPQSYSWFRCYRNPEMIGPDITPEDGVTRYEHDHTQGPACAIAAGAATIWRNYFVPVETPEGVQSGQTEAYQIDTLAALGAALSEILDTPVARL